MARPHAGQDVGHARDAPPRRIGRAAGAGRRPRHAHQLAAAGLAPLLRGHRRRDARAPGRDRRRPLRHADDPSRSGDRPCAAPGQRGVRRARVLGLGHVPQAGRQPRAAVLRARRRPQRHVRRSPRAGSGARCPSPPRTPSAPSSSATSPRSPAARGASSRAGGASRAVRRCGSRSRASAIAWWRCWPTARRCWSAATTSTCSGTCRHRRACACCPASTRTRSRCRRRPSRSCRWRDGRWCRGRRAGSARCSSSAGAVAGTWTHEQKKARLAIDVAPWRRLTKAERRAVDDEAARIGAFLDAQPDVTIGDPV